MIFWNVLDTFNLLGFRHTQLEIPIILKDIFKKLR